MEGVTAIVSTKNPNAGKKAILHILPRYSTEDGGMKKGVSFELPHGSIFIEVAKCEEHASYRKLKEVLEKPTRIGLVLFQHRYMNRLKHGVWNHCQRNAYRNPKRPEQKEEFEAKLDNMSVRSTSNMPWK